ncbi:SpeB arginase/agmatinase/formimionoglutamate hydrolase SpeB [Agaricicola taiwanensis]|uniref:SpeB arginase/agmatinase/formimionoglutamate hydrolase SpeB n=1 Tax=Agaricicola taiwanensis TaxID=591372 RepID=A0A8J2YMH1_9RHOB|nr:arginase family protein [Agaricicola taiwanensis]GGE53573.1 SpeB arginase/agmatinase/formimionoglutamate hydrolase SpeB [Agaricicola taiwanensis]
MRMIGDTSRLNRGYVGIPTFLRSDYCADLDMLKADFAVFGVPFDEGSPFLPGSRFGPRSIREHSLRFSPNGLFDPSSGRVYLADAVRRGLIADVGDVDVVPTSPGRTFDNLTCMVAAIREHGAVPVMLGGDHAVSFPAVRGFQGEDIHVIQFDAHIDYGIYDPEFRYGNGQGFRQINELTHVASLTQVGIRSFRTNPDDFFKAKADGSRIVTMDQFKAQRLDVTFGHIPEGASVYVSIDIDAYDAPLVPGCVSAEPEGFSFAAMRGALGHIAAQFKVAGFDLVEVNPTLDVGTGVTSYLGALTVAMFMGEIMNWQASA